MDREIEQNRFLFFLLVFFILLAILFSAGNFKFEEIIRLENARVEKIAWELARLELGAKAVSVYDFSQNKKIWGLSDNVDLPIASLAKIMTVTIALNNLGSDRIVTITQEALRQSGNFGFFVGESWRALDLAKITLAVSANDGAQALASATNLKDFGREAWKKGKRIGMEDGFFLSTTGLDELEDGVPIYASAYATARDLNTLAYYALRAYPKVAEATTKQEISLVSESGFTHNYQNTNPIVGKIPNLLFSKTGFTDLAGGNLTIILKDKKGDLIAVTLLGSTYEGRFTDMEKIVEVLYN